MGISAEGGGEHWQIFKKSVDIPKFKEYIEGLRADNKDKKIAIFMDNLSVHHSRKTKEALAELEIPYVFNVAYSPELNPIELVFSQIKRHFYNERSTALVKGKKPDIVKLIKRAVENLEIEKIRNCVRHSLTLIN